MDHLQPSSAESPDRAVEHTETPSPSPVRVEWLRGGRRVVAALLVGVEGSAPLQPGATMLVASDGAIEGSITGGRVESAVLDRGVARGAAAPPCARGRA